MVASECDRELIARRELTNVRTGGLCTISIFRPRRANADDDAPEWECKVELRAGTEVKTEHGRGIDSLQALANAHALLLRAVGSNSQDLRWIGEPGHLGLPFVVLDPDPDFLQLVRHLVIAESYRMSVVQKAVDAIFRRRSAQDDDEQLWLRALRCLAAADPVNFIDPTGNNPAVGAAAAALARCLAVPSCAAALARLSAHAIGTVAATAAAWCYYAGIREVDWTPYDPADNVCRARPRDAPLPIPNAIDPNCWYVGESTRPGGVECRYECRDGSKCILLVHLAGVRPAII